MGGLVASYPDRPLGCAWGDAARSEPEIPSAVHIPVRERERHTISDQPCDQIVRHEWGTTSRAHQNE